MKVSSLEIENFRQFYKNQIIEFSTDSKKPITVIHGENGSGKTALLNAFKWVLYGRTDFDSGKKLLNERILYELKKGEVANIVILMKFDNEGKQYLAKRTQKYRKIDDFQAEEVGGDVFKLEYTNSLGEYVVSNNSDTEIMQIIPEDLHSYFFFNGERIDKLANTSSAEEIKLAIKKLLGIEIIERAQNHLSKYVIKELKKELKKVSPDALSEKIDEQTKISESIENLRKEIRNNANNRSEYEKELKEIDIRMKGKEEISLLQEERLTIEDENKKLQNTLKDIIIERKKFISKFGFIAFTDDLISKSENILEEKRKKGELPSNVKEQFIKDLLEHKKCICGRELLEGSDPHKFVSEFLNRSVPSDVEDAFLNTAGSIQKLKKQKDFFYNKFEEHMKRISNIELEKKKNNGRLDVINQKIGSNKSEEIESLELKRDKLKTSIEESIGKKAIFEKELQELSESLSDCEIQIKQTKAENVKQDLAQRRYDFANECLRVVKDIYEVISNNVKDNLSKKVNKAFTSIMRKNYQAEISNDYALNIYKSFDKKKILVHEKSTGENQVASLAFIGSIVSLCKENFEADKMKYMKGGIFPIVMDSPYGTLDKEYKSLVAQIIPELADQIILMVSDSQWSGEVENELINKTGKRYTLMYHAPDVTERTNSKAVVKDKYEFTEIKGGYYGR